MSGDEVTQSVLCIDVGGTSTKFGIVGSSREIGFFTSIPTRGPAEAFADSLCRTAVQILEKAQESGTNVAGLGVAIAGFLNDERDRLLYNSNLAWLEDYPLRERLAAKFDLPIELESDSNAATLGEYYLGRTGASSRFMCIALGTGFGVGMIVDGQLLRFAYGCMGDPGHIIVQPDGPLCACGGHGCVEHLVSAPRLAGEFQSKMRHEKSCDLRDVIHAARGGNEAAITILEQAGKWIGIATASLANIFFPDRIVFAGGLAEADDLVMKSVKQSFMYSASSLASERAVVTRAALGAMSTLTGAAYSILTR